MISQSRYIKIVSGVGAGAAVAVRKLSLRVMTSNTVLPPGIVAEFSTADAVGSYFGYSSEEYKRAALYFGFISKQINSPDSISFSRIVSTAIPAMVIGDTEPKVLATFQAFTGAILSITYDGTDYLTDAINLSAATSLANVAELLETAINTKFAAEGGTSVPALADAEVYWNANTQQFTLEAAPSTAGAGNLSINVTGQPTDPSQALGWTTTGTVTVAGQGVSSPVEAIAASVEISNNFGSFLFAGADRTLEEITAVAAWNHSQNNMYMYLFSTSFTNIGSYYTALKGYSGVGMMIRATNLANDYIDQAPAEILAATNYNTVNATQNYMYYQFDTRNVTVSTDSRADTADQNRANYIGATQQAGQTLAFFQRGVLMGGSTAAVDMNTYANEMWLKSAITSQLFSMFLNLGRVPANEEGKATVQAMIQVAVDNAKVNGTISVGKALTEIQKQYITQTSGDNTAWRQVETIGYWLTVDFDTETTSDGRTEYYATYTLIYSKDDAVRRVEGRDVLI